MHNIWKWDPIIPTHEIVTIQSGRLQHWTHIRQTSNCWCHMYALVHIIKSKVKFVYTISSICVHKFFLHSTDVVFVLFCFGQNYHRIWIVRTARRTCIKCSKSNLPVSDAMQLLLLLLRKFCISIRSSEPSVWLFHLFSPFQLQPPPDCHRLVPCILVFLYSCIPFDGCALSTQTSADNFLKSGQTEHPNHNGPVQNV